MEFFSNQVQNRVGHAHPGDEPKLLEEEWVLLLDRGNQEPGAEFQVPDRAHRELSETQTRRGRTLAAKPAQPGSRPRGAPYRHTHPRLQNYQGTTVALLSILSFM